MKDFDVERGFISCLLGSRDIATVRDSRITPRFFTGDNRVAYTYILDISISTGELPTVRAFQQKFPRYDLYKFNNSVGTEENIKYWILSLREKVKLNSLADKVEESADLLNSGKVDEAVLALKKQILFIESEVEDTTDIKLNENLDLRKAEYEKKRINQGMTGIPTGIPFLDFMLKGLSPETLTTLIAQTSVGKAMPLDTPILTPNGFVPLRDIHTGSVVYDEEGKETTVLAEFPQKGEKQEYLVTFNDGTSVKCCKDHLWKYKTVYDTQRKGSDFWRVDTIENILSRYKSLSYGRGYLLSVPVCHAIEFSKKELLIPPYAMGALLGDGGFTQKQITFTNVEEDVKSKVFSQLSAFGEFYCSENKIQSYFKGGYNSNPFRDYIRETFNGCSSLNKFIPQEYLMSDIEDRLELVRGLIDTDGYIDKRGHVSFSSSSRKLCDDFIFVVRSLGYRTTFHGYTREGKDNKEFVVRVKSDDNRLFTSIKHTTAYNNREVGKKHHYELLKVVDIKPLDTFSDMKCISVGSPNHTFICKDFIVTHNTYIQILVGAYASLNGYKVLQCMTEMSERQMRDRYEMILYAMTYGPINNNRFRSGTLTKQEQESYFDFLDDVMPNVDLPMITAVSPMQIEANIDKYKPDLVLIDSVYLMQDDEKAESDWLRVAHITRNLKLIAKRKKVAIFINSQADKNTSKKTGPDLGDISFSQSIGMDSDNVLTAYRTELMYTDKELCIKILKGREGGSGKVTLSWDFSTMQFKEIYNEKDGGNDTFVEEEKSDNEGKPYIDLTE